MTGIEFGLAFQGDKPSGDYAHLARFAEQLGFDVLTVYGDLFYQPPIYPLLIMALHTASVRLGPACLNPFVLHPVEMAGQISSLDAVSGGRAFLGVARGSWLDQLGMKPDKPLITLKDALEVARRLLRRDLSGYRGEVYSLEHGTALACPPSSPSVPIMVGTWSRGASRLAARLANEVKVGGSANPAMTRTVRSWLLEDLPLCGREVDEVGVIMGAVTVVGRDGVEARRRAKREVAMYLDVVWDLDQTVQLPQTEIACVRNCLRQGNIEAAGRAVPDDILDLFAFAGTPEQVCRQVEDLARAGTRRVEFGTPHGESEEEGIRLLGERVLPNFH